VAVRGGPQRLGRAAQFDLAHKLRGPLNSLMVWSDVLEHHLRDAPQPVQDALAGLRIAVQQQAHFIETMLEQRRAEARPAATPTPGADHPLPPTR
jgi:signal transduction histidine kinase